MTDTPSTEATERAKEIFDVAVARLKERAIARGYKFGITEMLIEFIADTASAITSTEARAEARGRIQALEEAAKVECLSCEEGLPVENDVHTDVDGTHYFCMAKQIRALASRTGEGEADSADSGEEEKQSGEKLAEH